MTKTVVITGGANGIGRDAVERLLEEDYVIHVIDRDREALEEMEEVVKHCIDITDHYKVEKVVDEIEGVDILVNNAGYQAQGAAEDMEIEQFRKHTEVNYIAAVNTVKCFLPELRKNNGKIVNVSSVAGFTGFPFLSGYCASKYALEGFSDSLRKELEEVKVVLVEPGRVKTGFNERGIENTKNYPDSRYSERYNELQQEGYGGVETEKAGKKLAKIIKKGDKPRYTITREAWLLRNILSHIPSRIWDRLVRRIL